MAKEQRILVTGGAGYIGSHTVVELLASGGAVAVLDNLSKGHRKAVPQDARFMQADLHNRADVDRVFAEFQPTAVVHFAAESLVGESVQNPAKYFRNNLTGALNLLDAMVEHHVDRIVFSSTAATYGEPVSIPIRESDPTVPTNPYGESKLTIEKILKWYGNAYGIRYVALRYFNAAGAHESGAIGEDHSPETHLIPIVLWAAVGKIPKVSIFGTDYETKDGTCVRDYIHVTDLAAAHVLALERLASGGSSTVFNLGNGEGFSVREIINVAEKVTGRKIPVQDAPRRPGDPAVLVASSDRARAELGWKPRLNDIADIVGTAWKWHAAHPDGYNDRK